MSITYAPYNYQIEKVIQKIEHALDEDLCIEELSYIAGYSRSHFQELFKGYTGESIGNYLKRVRIERSAFMIKYQYKKIIDVGIRTGFNNNTSFTRAFKSYYNISPMEFKQSVQNFEKREETPDFTKVTIDDFKVFFIREFGDFEKSSFNALQKANHHFKNLIDEKSKCVTMCFGEETITKNFDKLKYEACIMYDSNKHSNIKNLPVKTIAGGNYAKFSLRNGTPDDFEKFHYQVYHTFYHDNSFQVSLKPSIHIHHNPLNKVANGVRDTDLLVPVD